LPGAQPVQLNAPTAENVPTAQEVGVLVPADAQ
jgi:hypothetical protein